MNRLQMQLGFILILVALLTGLTLPVLANPRLGLAAHIVGITGGLILIAMGALARAFVLGRRAAAAMMALWVYAAYANWLACLLGGITGASRLTPIAGAGTSGTALAEGVVSFLLQSLGVAAIAGTVLAIYGLRRVAPAEAAQPAAALPPA